MQILNSELGLKIQFFLLNMHLLFSLNHLLFTSAPKECCILGGIKYQPNLLIAPMKELIHKNCADRKMRQTSQLQVLRLMIELGSGLCKCGTELITLDTEERLASQKAGHVHVI